MTNDFNQLGITSCFVKKLEDRSITQPTDIQLKIIPRLTSGESVFFTSATGTGKTYAYLLPLLGAEMQGMQGNDGKVKFLIITPTLELCTQINSELEFLLEGTGLRSALVIGSVNLDRQIENLKKIRPNVIVGNPNRLLILVKKRILRLDNIRFLVLDEADRLTSDEMSGETEELCRLIIQYTKKKVQFSACSATMNLKCREKLAFIICGKDNTIDVPFIESEGHEILRDKIEHWAIFSEKRRKDQALRSLLAAIKTKAKKSKVKMLVFTSRGDEAALILSRLHHHHIACAGLFGKIGKKPISGQERKAALDAFRQGSIEVLVSTDLAARGLDIPGITHVIALDVPNDSEVYIHRCGRTGRAGKRGIMVTIGDETQMHLLAVMEKKLKIKVIPKELHYGKICAPLPMDEVEYNDAEDDDYDNEDDR